MSEQPPPDTFWRILVVDDLPLWAESIRQYGQLFNCRVRLATSLEAGLRQVAHWNPHVIILDLHMPYEPWEPIPSLRRKYRPNQKTLAFCEQITSHPELNHITVVIASVEQQDEHQAFALQAGAQTFYNKGEFTVSDFEELLEQVKAKNNTG